VDSQGRVIGINTAMIQAAQGLCFAVSVNTARFVLTEILRKGRVERPYIGIQARTVPVHQRVQRKLGLDSASMIEVLAVDGNEPAWAAGIRPGDFIVAVDNTPVSSMDDLHHVLNDASPGGSLLVSIIRSGRRRDVVITTRAR
jgi:S1-C subfamily serine protease